MAESLEPARKAQRPRPLDRLRLLIVDDHLDTLDILDQALSDQGAIVTTAIGARSALAALDGVDVVVTDYKMPGEDGVWLLQQVRALGKPTPVIAFTGFSLLHHPRFEAAGFARVLLKPVDPWRLAAEIAAVVRR